MIQWQWASYEELSRDDLYSIMMLRQEVFIVEQNCPYQDADGYDRRAWHLMGWQEKGSENQLVAYLRVVFPGEKYAEPSFGRVVTAPATRGEGLGKQLMSEAVSSVGEIYTASGVRISAQQYLVDFYHQFGFEVVSEPYDEDGIPHLEMLLPANRF